VSTSDLFDATMVQIRMLVGGLVADAQASENQVGYRRGYDAACQDFGAVAAANGNHILELEADRDALRLEVEALKHDLETAARGHQCEGGCPAPSEPEPPAGMVRNPADKDSSVCSRPCIPDVEYPCICWVPACAPPGVANFDEFLAP